MLKLDPMNNSLILASNSPRRKQLLQLFELPYEVHPADIDESLLPGETPEGHVSRVARAKGTAISKCVSGLVISADTIVVHQGCIMGKPSTVQMARNMLLELRGKTHQVFSAIVLIPTDRSATVEDICVTNVPMRDYSDQELEAYIQTGDPMDKAGAYAIQHAGFHPVTALQGCYASVMGLPLCHLTRSLRKLGLSVQVDIPSACQNRLGYTCRVFNDILSI